MGTIMRTVVFRCPGWMFSLLISGAFAPLCLLPMVAVEGWPPPLFWIFVGVSVFMAIYALTLLPTRMVISDEGIDQKLLFSEMRLQWKDLIEWRHCEGGETFETNDLRAQTNGRWHSIEFWVKDKTGKKYYFKRWLVFGHRSKILADILREQGIAGG